MPGGPGLKSILLGIGVCLLLGPPMRAQPGATLLGDTPPRAYAVPHRLVAIEPKRRLNLFCLGSGAPVVMLESGLGGDTRAWRRVQSRIAGFTTACAYDRAGYGFSDPSSRPSTAANIAADLHGLLHAAAIPRPVVLVAHSAGGLYAIRFAETYPVEVGGMVLVDPSFEGQGRAFKDMASRDEVSAQLAAERGELERQQGCAMLARAQKLGQLTSRCGPSAGEIAPELKATLRLYRQPKFYEALFSESAAFQTSIDKRVDASQPGPRLGNMPLTVLTASRIDAPPFVGAQTKARSAALWRAGHDRLAARSTAGQSVVVAGAGHDIQSDEPDAVVDAVGGVVAAVRGGPRTAS